MKQGGNMKTTANEISKRPPGGSPGYRADNLIALRRLLADRKDVREGRMFGYPAFFVGRRLFACVYGDGIGIKVPVGLAARLLQRPDTEPFRPYGKSTMREWIQINHAKAADYRADLSVFLASLEFASHAPKGGGRQ